jgi:hypothetical protein
MNKIGIVCLIFLLIAPILLSGCGNSPTVQVNELGNSTVSYDETIHINNCGGKADSEQTASRSFATSIEGGAEISAGYQSIVEGSVSAKYSQYRNVTKSQKLTAPPATNMEFILKWSEDVHSGNVTVNGATGNYEVRIPVSVEQTSSQDLGCGGIVQVQPSPISVTVQPATAVQPTTAANVSSCNWENDWQLQSDGSYLWVGSPPGTPACQNVGQAGEILQRLRNGENLTLVVEVGDNFLGLAICRGNYTATKVIDGQKCVPNNPELWIKVSGTLTVTGSDGFLVGTGK